MRRQRLDHPPSFKSVASDVFAILDWSHNEAIQPVRRSLNPPLILLGQGASGHLMLGACSEEDSRLLLRGFNHGLLAVAFPNLGKVIEKSRRESSPRSNRAAVEIAGLARLPGRQILIVHCSSLFIGATAWARPSARRGAYS
jgi:hypothetical protein